MSIFFVGNLIA